MAPTLADVLDGALTGLEGREVVAQLEQQNSSRQGCTVILALVQGTKSRRTGLSTMKDGPSGGRRGSSSGTAPAQWPGGVSLLTRSSSSVGTAPELGPADVFQ